MEVKYRDLSLEDQELTVTFDSEGEDSLTIDDVKAMGQVLKASHSHILAQNIWGVTFEIFNKKGKLIILKKEEGEWKVKETADRP